MKKYLFKSAWKRASAACLDAVGDLLFYPVRSSRKPMDLGTIKRILAIRLDHIGDVVMTRPAIRALHKKFPHAAIDLLVSEDLAPLFASAKEIARVIPVPNGWFSRKAPLGNKIREFFRLWALLKKERYDLGLDFRGDFRNILLMFLAGIRYRLGYGLTGGGFLLTEDIPFDATAHQILIGLNLLRFFHVAQDNKLLPFEYSQEQAQAFWQVLATELPTTVLPRVMVHMGAGSVAKQWGNDNFRALLQKISEANLAQILLIGSQEERDALPDLKLHVQNIIDLRGKARLQDLPVLMDACDVFIGNDSGPAHIAAAQGLEVVLIASGTNDIRFWHPWTERLRLLHYDVPCSPCELKVCPVAGHLCLENITVEQVFDAFRSVLDHLQKP
ncbi:MAG TPA: glycosyltransferase family 9 protein [Candidatus Omnitrophota bacterium]|nr:glycosyltransferase family 9 protein [Candidatus Omnitrophota bacterium]HPS37689.1 glycosyltransferase family 9 protein [Candidatus Omnitrophota bacterium]